MWRPKPCNDVNQVVVSLASMSPILLLLPLIPLANAYSWKFSSQPTQCQNLTISISGNDGKPPYRILIIPFGPSPLANSVEARKIIDQPFDGDSTSLSFKLNFPGNSQFVAVVSICFFCFFLLWFPCRCSTYRWIPIPPHGSKNDNSTKRYNTNETRKPESSGEAQAA